ncbi:MAG: hypothetical protein IPM06_18955 [Rhizobiales bacterium]|nr:hypothetical protein [Hyphomicrobiales bacterium]
MRIDVYHHWSEDSAIMALLQAVITRSDNIMANLDALNAESAAQSNELTQINDTIAAEAAQVAAAIQALKDQIAAGGSITEAQLDPVLVNMQNVTASLAASRTAVEAIFTLTRPSLMERPAERGMPPPRLHGWRRIRTGSASSDVRNRTLRTWHLVDVAVPNLPHGCDG